MNVSLTGDIQSDFDDCDKESDDNTDDEYQLNNSDETFGGGDSIDADDEEVERIFRKDPHQSR